MHVTMDVPQITAMDAFHLELALAKQEGPRELVPYCSGTYVYQYKAYTIYEWILNADVILVNL